MRIILRIIGLALRHKWLLFGAYLSTAIATGAYLVLPRLFGEAVDRLALAFEEGAYSESAVFTLALLIVGTSAVRGIFAFGQMYLGEALAQTVSYDARNSFYDHVQHLSFGFHDRHHTGNLMSRAITDVEALRMVVHMGIVRTPYYLLLFLGTAFLILRLDWRLGLLSSSFMPMVAVLSGIARVHLRRVWMRIQQEMAELSTVLQENLTGVRVVKAFAAEEYEKEKFNEKSADVAHDLVKAGRLDAMNGASMVTALLVAIGLVVWYGGYRVINGDLTAGQLAQFLFYMQILALPVRQTGMMVSVVARAMASGGRLFEILDAKSQVQEAPNAVDIPRVKGDVRFEDVGFSYREGVQVLDDINIDAPSGSVTALLGAPGSGKSTIVHLLPRFYEVDSGRITVDGVDIREASLRSLRRNIGLVQQDVFLFTASIRDNIAYGREHADIEEVVRAAKIAQLHEYIETLDEGYETKLGERGVTLSGGQRQRLSIARAVLLDPPVLVLDDSTSSVDAHTEELIRRAMESVTKGRTTFVIAHRLSTVHRADQILVLRDGQVVERGTHGELLSAGAVYREIYDLQLRPQEDVMLDIDVPTAGRVQ